MPLENRLPLPSHSPNSDSLHLARQKIRLCFEESLVYAHKSSLAELLWLAHAHLAALAEESWEQDYHRSKSRQKMEQLLATIPATYLPGYQKIFLDQSGLVPANPLTTPAANMPDDYQELLRINRELTREHQMEKVLTLILDRSIELMGAERGFVILSEQGKIKVEMARNIDQETLRNKEFKFSHSVAEKVMTGGEPFITGCATDDDWLRESHSVHQLNLRSVICVPLKLQEQTLGALYLDNRFRRGAFQERHLALLSAFADQAAIALANARLLEEAEKRNIELAQAKARVETLNAELKATIEAQADRIDEMVVRLGDDRQALVERYRASKLVGQSPGMCQIMQLIDRVVATEVPVLIQGETGTGKEVIAKAIHYQSRRRHGPFVTVNCAAIPGPLLESELFGHARGSFTGAVRDKPGLFQIAAGGTLLLDEVGDMPLEMQPKLLRILQEAKYRRIGEEQERTTDVRIISASLHDLTALLADGHFRRDLYFRLNVIPINVPPLRERTEDIPLLIDHFLGQLEPTSTIDRAARLLLLRYHWPGNVRELQNELQRAAALSDGHITAANLSPKLQAGSSAPVEGNTMESILSLAERRAIEKALKQTHGSITQAAKLLGISRVVFHRKMKKFDIQRHKYKS